MKITHLLVIVLISIFVGCSTQTLNQKLDQIQSIPSLTFYNPNQKITPPLFSLTTYDPNHTNPKFIKKMKEYDKIIKSSEIPVFIMSQKDLPEDFRSSVIISKLGTLYGLYIKNGTKLLYPKRFIFINIDATPEEIIITFFHEYQHYQCDINNCYCSTSNNLPEDEQMFFSVLREKHAIENELKESLRLKDSALVIVCVRQIASLILYGKDCTYKIGAISIYRDDLWKKAGEFMLGIEKGK